MWKSYLIFLEFKTFHHKGGSSFANNLSILYHVLYCSHEREAMKKEREREKKDVPGAAKSFLESIF